VADHKDKMAKKAAAKKEHEEQQRVGMGSAASVFPSGFAQQGQSLKRLSRHQLVPVCKSARYVLPVSMKLEFPLLRVLGAANLLPPVRAGLS
jgi:hypothetical protein